MEFSRILWDHEVQYGIYKASPWTKQTQYIYLNNITTSVWILFSHIPLRIWSSLPFHILWASLDLIIHIVQMCRL
jgi:hypothetical protein